jgi:tagaturonate reductase
MKKLNRVSAGQEKLRPVKVLQFGEGNFLRAFVDWIIDILNEQTEFNGGVQVIQPIRNGMGQLVNAQDGLYHVLLQGIQNGKPLSDSRMITCVHGVLNPYEDKNAFLKSAENVDLKFIVSNTTEAGIAFSESDASPDILPESFPGKLTVLLHHRFTFLKGAADKGLILLPCELIEKNGENLKSCILQYIDHWKLSNEFKQWVIRHNTFCNTLVDRIVPGFPKENIGEIQAQLGYEDNLVVKAEPFHLWVIEGPEHIREHLPAEKTNLNVVFTNDLTPYRSRKVRILNGAHTAMVPVAYLNGLRTVKDAIEDPSIGEFIRAAISEEIIPTLDLPESKLKQFASDVIERFQNPYIKHELISISLNSISKFAVRVLPSITTYYQRKGKLPHRLTYALAALFVFYRGKINNETIPLNDSPEILDIFRNAWKNDSPSDVINAVANNNNVFKLELKSIPGLIDKLGKDMREIVALEKKSC